MNALQRFVFESRGGMFREFEGLTTHFKPRDVDLYRKLLPPQFGVPSQPIVTIFVADYLRVHPRPLVRYQEWSVLLKAERGDDSGWFSLTMPVTRWLPMIGGRHLGFPKYVIDEISLSTGPDGRVARARYRNLMQLTLEFRAGGWSAPISALARASDRNEQGQRAAPLGSSMRQGEENLAFRRRCADRSILVPVHL